MSTILLIGKNGQVGWQLQNALLPHGRVIALARTQMDLTQADAIRTRIREISPDIIVNAAGYTTVDKAEDEPGLAMLVNATAPGILAEEARRLHALLVHYSTDYVYDGKRAGPYVEEDEPNPVNTYGKSKLAGERAIRAVGCKHLILRASWIYSARGTNFVLTMLRLARERKDIAVVNDQIGSPTAARELARSTALLLGNYTGAEQQTGVFHLSASGYASRFEFANAIIDTAKRLSGERSGWATISATTTKDFPLPAMRPLNAATSKEKIRQVFGIEMPVWKDQLHANFKELISAHVE